MTLSKDEEDELLRLAFIVVADLPMATAQIDRYRALKSKRDAS